MSTKWLKMQGSRCRVVVASEPKYSSSSGFGARVLVKIRLCLLCCLSVLQSRNEYFVTIDKPPHELWVRERDLTCYSLMAAFL